MAVDLAADTLEGDTPLRLRAEETLTVAMRIPPRLVETSTAGKRTVAVVPMVEAAPITVVVDITAVERILDPVSVLAFTRLTDMPPRPAILLDSMINTASGSIIRVAPCLTDIKLDGQL